MSKLILFNRTFLKTIRLLFICGMLLFLTVSAVNGRDRLPQDGIPYFVQMMKVNVVFFDAKVLEIGRNSALVHRPFVDETIAVSFNQIPEEALKEGDWVTIKFDGMILESDPPQIHGMSVKRVSNYIECRFWYQSACAFHCRELKK